MEKLSIDEMENITGGQKVNTVGCIGAGLGVIGLVASVAAVPVTGGVSLLAFSGIMAGAVGTGLSLADCFKPLILGEDFQVKNYSVEISKIDLSKYTGL